MCVCVCVCVCLVLRRHHIGYVSSSQFGQCLGYLDLPVTKEEGEVLRKAFSDAKGFNYLRFLDHVECMERGVAMPPGGEQRKEVCCVKGEGFCGGCDLV